MGEHLKIKEYPLILLFIITGAILLMSTNDMVSIFLAIELQSYGLYILSTIYRNSELSTAGGLIYFLLGGAEWRRMLLLYCLELSNSGDALKLLVPSYSRESISRWTNHSCTVTSQKIYENKVGNRGSKSIVRENTIVKEQRVDGSLPISSLSRLDTGIRYTLKGFERNSQTRILSNHINLINNRLY